MKKYNKYFWFIFFVGFGVVAFTLSPIVIANGKYEPYIFGLPFNFGLTLIMSFILLIITIIAAYFLQKSVKEK